MQTVQNSDPEFKGRFQIEAVDSFQSLSDLILRGELNFQDINRESKDISAEDRIRFLLRINPDTVITSSFGAQAAVTLSLAVKVMPDIPVLFIDTQYHFPETYSYAEELKYKLKLNLHTFRSDLSRQDQENKFGELWLQGDEGFKRYTLLNKIAPLNSGLEQLKAGAWISGIRKSQNWTRASAEFLEVQDGRLKLHPIADWSDDDITQYMKVNRLYPHPLWYAGFKRIGDIHTTEYPKDWQGNKEISFDKRECRMHTSFAQTEENGSGI